MAAAYLPTSPIFYRHPLRRIAMPRTTLSHRLARASMAMLLLLGLTCFPGCGSSEQSATAESKKFRPVDESAAPAGNENQAFPRSEEHTSELQSRGLISY